MTKDNQSNLNSQDQILPPVKSNPNEKHDNRYLTKSTENVITKLLAQGENVNTITGIVNVNHETVESVEKTCQVTIEAKRKALAGRLAVIVEPVLDRIHRQVQDDTFVTSTKDLAITSGILLDKMDRLSGVPTQIIRVEESDPGRSEYERWLHAKEINISDDAVNPGEGGIPLSESEQSI